MKRATFWIDHNDESAIAVIMEAYGTRSRSGAVRLALRVTADSVKGRGRANSVPSVVVSLQKIQEEG